MRLIATGFWLTLGASGLAGAEATLISGRVTAMPRAKPASSEGGAYGNRALRYATPFDYQHLKNVVVYAEPVGAKLLPAPSPSSPALLTLRKIGRHVMLTPDFQAMATGRPLTLKNNTDQPVTIYSSAGSAATFQVTIEPKAEKQITLSETGPYQVRCLEDVDAQAEVFAAGSFFTIAQPDGSFVIPVPPAQYRVTAWHHRLPPRTQDAEVVEGHNVELNFDLSVKSALPEVK